MLTERQMQAALGVFQARMQGVSDAYFRKMGEHIRDIGRLTPSDVHRLQQLRRMNRNLIDVKRQLAGAARTNLRDLEDVLRETAKVDPRVARKILGVPDSAARLVNNVPLQRMLRAQYAETAGRLANLSNTTVASNAYRNAIDAAVTAVQSGAEDYGSAIRRTLRQAGSLGLRVRENGTQAVEYASGHTRRVDTAVRMNVLDAMRRLNQSALMETGQQFGADGVEIDAHPLCAPDHLPYQGGQYSNAEFDEIQNSLPRPFGEWNCRHTWSPILLGISRPAYSPEQLEAFERYSTDEVEIDGVTRTRYEWSQQMRRVEARMRAEKDTATLARYAGLTDLRRQCQGAVDSLMRQYERLSEKAGLDPEYRRLYVAGFRDVSGAGALTGASNGATIQAGALNGFSKRAEEHAERYYESVRHMKTDVQRIAKNVGWSENDIQRVKEHVFIKDHDLGDRTGRFDPSYYIAESWQRLIQGKGEIQEQDVVLLQHELLESQLEDTGLSYEQAHAKAEKKYNYSKYIPKEDMSEW